MNTAIKHVYPTEVKHFMPLNLKKKLARYGITQSKLALATCQERGQNMGKPLSQPAISRLIHTGEWPTFTRKSTLIQQITDFWLLNNLPVEELEYAFEIDEEAEGVDVKRRVRVRPKVLHFPEHKNLPVQPVKSVKPKSEFFAPEPEMLSPIAKKKFKLFVDPFTNDIKSSRDVFLNKDQRYVRESLFQVAKHDGFIALIGESGSGKTTIKKDLIDRAQKEKLDMTVIQPRAIDKAKLTTGAICDAVICDLSTEKPKIAPEAKARQVESLLMNSSRAGNSHVLIIDEAHDLSIPTLKYLKRFYELEDGFKKLLSIILIGQPELKDKLNERLHFEAREVIRRIEIVELQPLDEGLEAYLELKFNRCNRKLSDIFEDDAFNALRKRLSYSGRGNISMLYPLMVNNAITRAINIAAELDLDRIDAQIIKKI